MNNTINLMINNTTNSNRQIVIAFLSDFIKDEKLKGFVLPIIEKLNDSNKELAINFINEFLTPDTKEIIKECKKVITQECKNITQIRINGSDDVKPTVWKSTGRKPVSGNGHKSDKKRDINDWEKDYMRQEFYNLKGMTYRNDSKKMRSFLNQAENNPRLTKSGDERAILSPAQVTGFVSYLHRQVKDGEFIIPMMDMVEYNELQALKRSGKDVHRQKLSKVA